MTAADGSQNEFFDTFRKLARSLHELDEKSLAETSLINISPEVGSQDVRSQRTIDAIDRFINTIRSTISGFFKNIITTVDNTFTGFIKTLQGFKILEDPNNLLQNIYAYVLNTLLDQLIAVLNLFNESVQNIFKPFVVAGTTGTRSLGGDQGAGSDVKPTNELRTIDSLSSILKPIGEALKSVITTFIAVANSVTFSVFKGPLESLQGIIYGVLQRVFFV